jgi:meso-butanediol dehydrogenase/(S,S)-butanediol dehydrogenase/diacetyl reductase
MAESTSTLENQAAVVTGAARGIGRSIALALARAGADVAIADLPAGHAGMTYEMSGRDELDAVAREVTALGRRALAIGCDVTQKADVAALAERVRAELGRVDLVVNNAGVVHFAPLAEIEEERWDRLYAVNVKGAFLVTQAFLADLVASRGSVINIASVAGKRGYPLGSLYCSSKFAVVGLTQSLAMELGPQGVRVNAICPGILATHMWTDHLASEERGGKATYEAMVARSIPLGRDQSPEDVAGAALYLATAPNVTGVALNVAGGMEVW